MFLSDADKLRLQSSIRTLSDWILGQENPHPIRFTVVAYLDHIYADPPSDRLCVQYKGTWEKERISAWEGVPVEWCES